MHILTNFVYVTKMYIFITILTYFLVEIPAIMRLLIIYLLSNNCNTTNLAAFCVILLPVWPLGGILWNLKFQHLQNLRCNFIEFTANQKTTNIIYFYNK